MLTAVCQVHLLLHVLVIADADVGRGRQQQHQALHAQAREGMVNQLRFQPGDFPQVVELHFPYFSLSAAMNSSKAGSEVRR